MFQNDIRIAAALISRSKVSDLQRTSEIPVRDLIQNRYHLIQDCFEHLDLAQQTELPDFVFNSICDPFELSGQGSSNYVEATI